MSNESIVLNDGSIFFECHLKYDESDGDLIVSESTIEIHVSMNDQYLYSQIKEGSVLLFNGLEPFYETPDNCTLANMQIVSILTNNLINNQYYRIIFNVDIPSLFEVSVFFVCFLCLLFKKYAVFVWN